MTNVRGNDTTVQLEWIKKPEEEFMSAQRMVYLTGAVLILLGISLTGFTKVHWVMYLPVALLTFAGITGFCPGLVFWSRILYK
jgi:hypothetical protein